MDTGFQGRGECIPRYGLTEGLDAFHSDLLRISANFTYTTQLKYVRVVDNKNVYRAHLEIVKLH